MRMIFLDWFHDHAEPAIPERGGLPAGNSGTGDLPDLETFLAFFTFCSFFLCCSLFFSPVALSTKAPPDDTRQPHYTVKLSYSKEG